MVFWLVGKLGWLVMHLLLCTVRVSGPRPRERAPLLKRAQRAVHAIWHHSLLLATYRYRNQGVLTLISQHRDGEYIARIAQELGFVSARGSTTRGGARALIELRNKLRQGRDVAITTDGPRGPRQQVQMGVVFLAQVTGLPLVPYVIGLQSFWEMPSWDRFRIPKPFSRAVARFGKPVVIPKGAPPEELKRCRQQLQDAMCALQHEVDAEVQRRN